MSSSDETASGLHGVPVYQNTNGMPLSGGKSLHMEIGAGQLANRIITVGHESRAAKIAAMLDSSPSPQHFVSTRGFTTITGHFKGVLVSVVSIGMGPSMMDFFVRESRAVVAGPMAIVRYGTCGGISEDATAGCIVIASEGSGYICRNPDSFVSLYSNVDDDIRTNVVRPYHLSKIAPASIELSNIVYDCLESELGSNLLRRGVNVSADSFYSSQGRVDSNFHDNNLDVLQLLNHEYSNPHSLEMESFFLLHLAQCSKVPIKAAAAAIVVAHRPSGQVLDGSSIDALERKGGEALLEAIVQIIL